MKTKLNLAKFTQNRLENITKKTILNIWLSLKLFQVLMLIIEMKLFFLLMYLLYFIQKLDDLC